MAAPSPEPGFDAGHPLPALAEPAAGQRRFNLLIVGLTILLAAGLVGDLLTFGSRQVLTG